MLVPESRTGDDLDETGQRSAETGVSGVSSMSEGEPEADYDTDLEMEDPDSKFTFLIFAYCLVCLILTSYLSKTTKLGCLFSIFKFTYRRPKLTGMKPFQIS